MIQHRLRSCARAVLVGGLGCLFGVVVAILAGLVIGIGFRLVFWTRVSDALVHCLQHHSFQTEPGPDAFVTGHHHQLDSNRLLAAFCLSFAYPAWTFVEYARQGTVMNITSLAVEFPASTSRIDDLVEAVQVSISATFSTTRTSQSSLPSYASRLARFASVWVVPALGVRLTGATVSFQPNSLLQSFEPALQVNVLPDRTVWLPLDGQTGRLDNATVSVSLFQHSIPEISRLVQDWALWISDNGETDSGFSRRRAGHSQQPLERRAPPPLELRLDAVADVVVCFGRLPFQIPIRSTGQAVTIKGTLDISKLVGTGGSLLKFTRLDVNRLKDGHDSAHSGLEISAKAEALIPIRKGLPIRLMLPIVEMDTIPPINVTVSIPSNCSSVRAGNNIGSPPSRLAALTDVSVHLNVSTDPFDDIQMRFYAYSLLTNIPAEASLQCPDGSPSPLDSTLTNYLDGDGLLVYCHNVTSVWEHGRSITPVWILDVLAGLDFPVSLPISSPPSPLVDRLELETVRLHIPGSGSFSSSIGGNGRQSTDNSVDVVSLMARPTLVRLDATVFAYISLPEWPFPTSFSPSDGPSSPSDRPSSPSDMSSLSRLDDIIHARFVRAPNSKISYHGQELGILDITSWQPANSTFTRSQPRHDRDSTTFTDPHLRPFLLVRSVITKAPLRVTDSHVLASIVRSLVFHRQPVELRIDTHIDAAVQIAGLTERDGQSGGLTELDDPDQDLSSFVVLRRIHAQGVFVVSPE